MPKESILGFDLFAWDEWDEVDNNIWIFYNATFIPPSLKKFDGNNVTMSREGNIAVQSGEKEHEINLFSVPEFRNYIKQRIG